MTHQRKNQFGHILLLAVCATSAFGQMTKVDLRRQTRNVDFSGADYTKPSKTGTGLPSTCSLGETYFRTDATAGQNFYGCTAPNVWSLMSGSPGGAASTAELLDCKVSVAGSTVTVGMPCRLRNGSIVHSLPGQAEATLSGSAGSGTLSLYWDVAGRMVADENTAATLTCNAACVTASTGGFPLGATPIATVTFSNNVFGVLNDLRTFLSTKSVTCGGGLVCTESGSTGDLSVSADTTSLITKAALQSGSVLRCVSSAAGPSHTCSMNPPLLAYAAGMLVEFTSTAAPVSGATTLNINGLGAKPIKQSDGTSDPETIAAGLQIPLRYDGTAFRLPAETAIPAGLFSAMPACGAGSNGRVYLFTDSLYNFARCDGSAWRYFFDGLSAAPPANSWSWDNQTQGGAASLDASKGYHALRVPANHTAGYAVRYQTAPAGSYSRTFAMRVSGLWNPQGAGYMAGFRDSAGKLHGINIGFASGAGGPYAVVDVRRQASAASTSASGFDFPQTALASLPSTVYLRISDDTANLTFAMSVDGTEFHTLYSGPRTAYLSQPDGIFFGASAGGAATGAALNVISIQ
jgi:hypothetical protein